MGEGDGLERVRGFPHAGRRPDEDDVDGCKADEADTDRPRRRDRRHGPGGGEAGAGDECEAGRVLHEAARQPRRDPQPGRNGRPEPPTRAAAKEPAHSGEQRRPESREQRERMRPPRHEIDDRDAGPQQRRRRREPQPASPAAPRLPPGRRRRRGLHRAENRVRRDEGERQSSAESSE